MVHEYKPFLKVSQVNISNWTGGGDAKNRLLYSMNTMSRRKSVNQNVYILRQTDELLTVPAFKVYMN